MKRNQRALYDAFYNSTHDNEHLDKRTDILVGLAAAMALNCYRCMRHYLDMAKKAGMEKGAISEVLAKVMAVSAGQKRLQMGEVMEKCDTRLDETR